MHCKELPHTLMEAGKSEVGGGLAGGRPRGSCCGRALPWRFLCACISVSRLRRAQVHRVHLTGICLLRLHVFHSPFIASVNVLCANSHTGNLRFRVRAAGGGHTIASVTLLLREGPQPPPPRVRELVTLAVILSTALVADGYGLWSLAPPCPCVLWQRPACGRLVSSSSESRTVTSLSHCPESSVMGFYVGCFQSGPGTKQAIRNGWLLPLPGEPGPGVPAPSAQGPLPRPPYRAPVHTLHGLRV